MFVIYGPPGTGKTTYLCKNIIPKLSGRGAVLSFSRAAAGKLVSGLRPDPLKFVGTIHSLCFNILNLSPHDVVSLLKFEQDEGIPYDIIDESVKLDSLSLNMLCDHKTAYSKVWRSYSIEQLTYVIDRYKKWKRKNGLVDFNDMIQYTIDHAINVEKFEYIVIDEAQDLTLLQYKLLESLCAGELILTGDDDQSIYEFMGADPCIMLNALSQYRVLNKSFRCPEKIWKLANDIAQNIVVRKEKDWEPAPYIGEILYFPDYETAYNFINYNHIVLVRDQYRGNEIAEFLQSIGKCYTFFHKRSYYNSKAARAIRAVRRIDYDDLELLYPVLSKDILIKMHNKSITGDEQFYEILDLNKIGQEELNFISSVNVNDPDPIMISTIHGFKGEEADNVVLDCSITPLVQSSFDDQKYKDSEYRVWYTGVTRAKKRLIVVGNNEFIAGILKKHI